jgi:hypothetical protein
VWASRAVSSLGSTPNSPAERVDGQAIAGQTVLTQASGGERPDQGAQRGFVAGVLLQQQLQVGDGAAG